MGFTLSVTLSCTQLIAVPPPPKVEARALPRQYVHPKINDNLSPKRQQKRTLLCSSVPVMIWLYQFVRTA